MSKIEGVYNLKGLHTDKLEEKYGPIHGEVLKHNDEIREAYMLDEDNICRTYALTFLTFDRSNQKIMKIDQELKNQGLIGKVFRKYGYEVRKNVIEIFIGDLNEKVQKKMQTEETKAKVRFSEFYAKKEGEDPIIYGVVSEVYPPDFIPAIITEEDKSQDNPITEAMEKAGITKKEIWDRIGNNNDFSDIREKYEQAKILAVEKEKELKDKAVEYFKK
jgi:hypothetical protein